MPGARRNGKSNLYFFNGNDDLLTANIHYYFVDPGNYRSIYGADAQERALTVYGNLKRQHNHRNELSGAAGRGSVRRCGQANDR